MQKGVAWQDLIFSLLTFCFNVFITTILLSLLHSALSSTCLISVQFSSTNSSHISSPALIAASASSGVAAMNISTASSSVAAMNASKSLSSFEPLSALFLSLLPHFLFTLSPTPDLPTSSTLALPWGSPWQRLLPTVQGHPPSLGPT